MSSESETMRAEFEAWFRDTHYRRGQTSFKQRSDGCYHDPLVQNQWSTWQAAWSRAHGKPGAIAQQEASR